MKYVTCERCGANLDPGERGDCQDREQENPVIQEIKPMQGRKEIAHGSNRLWRC